MRFRTSHLSALIVLLLFLGITILPVHQPLSETSLDLLFHLRGDRPVSDDIVFIFIDSRDIQELGGWPITRDYYGYLTFILNQAGARVVGIDILFSSPNTRYPEYDQDFATFLETSGNVCLPFAFADISDSFQGEQKSFLLGNQPMYPIDLFRQHALDVGFSNIEDETLVRENVLAVAHENEVKYSMGLQLARYYLFGENSKIVVKKKSIELSNDSTAVSIPTDEFHRLHLNFFGNLDSIESMSLVDVLQTYQRDSESLDLKDKLVFVGVTAPGTAPMKVTPLHSSFPASLIHFTVAENILQRNFLRFTPWWIHVLILAGAIFLVYRYFALSLKHSVMALSGLVVYLLAAFLIFKVAHVVLPFMLPMAAVFISMIVFGLQQYIQERRVQTRLEHIYSEQIDTKQQELYQAEERFQQTRQHLETKLQSVSEESRSQLEEQQQEIYRLQAELRDLQTSQAVEESPVSKKFPQIIHAPDSPLQGVLNLVEKVSSDDIPVLITGETGTGKEVIAHAIHTSGKRADQAFVAVNCGALPETLLESELFGHEKGAFTGATSQRKGRFELADGGTLFLDEITETTAAFQAKLLRVLQEKTFERLGGEKSIRVDVRIIAASSKNITKQVQNDHFREDLFYRLNGFPIELPPLRERSQDILLLAIYFLKKHGYESISSFSDRAADILKSYAWPGNVRELENTIRRAAILAQSDGRTLIQEIDLPQTMRDHSKSGVDIQYQSLDEQILDTLRSLKFSHSSISQTAQALGNRDRSTITEYFRGLCFEYLVNASFDMDKAAQQLANTPESDVVNKVKSKMIDYTQKVKNNDGKRQTLFKGLPKKYHPYLNQLFEHYNDSES
mgnify:CR=1 FL=1